MSQQLKEFNKENLRDMRICLDSMLTRFGDEHGIEFKLGGIRFNAGTFGVKVDGSIKNHAQSKAVDVVLPRQMAVYKLQHQGTAGRVLTGYNARAKQYPFQYTQGGKNFKCSPTQAQAIFGIK